MVLKSSLVFEPTTSIEVFFDNIIEVGTTNNREIMNYGSSSSKEIKTFARNRHPSNTAYQGSIQTDIIEKKRKLVYLNAYADKVIVIDGGNGNAIYGNINPLDISDRNLSVADLSFTAVAKGGVTGQFYNITDVFSTGTTTADSNAVEGYAEVLDGNGEFARYRKVYESYELLAGDYMMFARVKTTNSVTDDILMSVNNTTDATTLSSVTFTGTTEYAYYTLDFTIGATDSGDQIEFKLNKTTSTANSIYVDFIGFVKV